MPFPPLKPRYSPSSVVRVQSRLPITSPSKSLICLGFLVSEGARNSAQLAADASQHAMRPPRISQNSRLLLSGDQLAAATVDRVVGGAVQDHRKGSGSALSRRSL
jgi:hypothetical protein